VAEAELETDALAVPFIATVDDAMEEEAPAELDADPLAEDEAATEDEAVAEADGVLDTGTGPPAPLRP
jgi:hypothetical protein